MRSRWLDTGFIVLFLCLWSETELRAINMQKREQGQYPAILLTVHVHVQVSQYRIYYNYGKRKLFTCGSQRGIPRGQESNILPTWLANHSARQ